MSALEDSSCSSFQEHVIDRAAERELQIFAVYQVVDENENIIDEKLNPVDMWQELRDLLQRMEEHPFARDTQRWQTADCEHLQQCYRKVSSQVLSVTQNISSG